MSQSQSEATSEYADVTDMFRRLKTLENGTLAYRRQREAIVERTLPLADHVARRYRNRGEPIDDLVPAAPVGLVNAVNRFDSDNGGRFPVVCDPDHHGRGLSSLPGLRLGGQGASPAQGPPGAVGQGARRVVTADRSRPHPRPRSPSISASNVKR